tara:strand:- start:2121 stop:3947 length:1827 start_codon:yes stop_codon:yes gene_type:complete
MGNNTLNTRSSGDVITADFFNDFNTALQTTQYGRNSSGAVVSGQNLGDSTFPFGTIYSNALIVGGSALDTSQITSPSNRIVSGSTRSTSNQPYFLKANGSAASVQITGNTTNLVVDINGSAVTCSTDITISSLSVAPSSNNTALVNMSDAADQELTRYWGEPPNKFVLAQAKEAEHTYYDYITIDTVGSEISNLVGNYAAFKINDGSNDEYFIAYVESATKLSHIIRGAFLNNVGKPINRIKFANNDTITLMKLTWIFLQNDGTTTDVTYTNPVWSTDEPGSPATGDYWYDLGASQWKRYSGSAFVTINRTLLGVCFQDTSNCVGTRSLDFFYAPKDINKIDLEVVSNTNVKAKENFSMAWVYSNTVRFSYTAPEWNITTDLLSTTNNDAYASESASTYYYLYLKENGDRAISDIGPIYRQDLRGHYHPSNPYLCVGTVYNNASSNFEGMVTTNLMSLLPATCIIRDEKAYNADGGAGSTSWYTRDLNTMDGETWFASLDSNKFILQPGSYTLQARTPNALSDKAITRLYDVTNSQGYDVSAAVTLRFNQDESGFTMFNSFFEIKDETEYRIENRLSNAGYSQASGFQQGLDSTMPSVFCVVVITKHK